MLKLFRGKTWQEDAAMKERRKLRRYRATLDAEYTKVEGCTIINLLTTTKNISLGGLCAALGRMAKRGDDLLVELDSPHNKKLATLVKVVWIKPADGTRRSICGLKFLWLSSKPMLSNWLTSLE